MGASMERQVLMRLLAGDDEASAAALAALQGSATYVVWDRTVPAERHAGVYARLLRRVRLKGIEPLGALGEPGFPCSGAMVPCAQWSSLVVLGHCRASSDGPGTAQPWVA